MALTPQQLAYRRDKITASDARVIMNATTAIDLIELYQRKIGEVVSEEDTYAMRAGVAMEPVILEEYQRQTGDEISRRGEIVDHPSIKNFCCTLDGWVAARQLALEAKFLSPYRRLEEIFATFYAQCAFQMACCDANEAILLVGQGTNPPVEIECIRDRDGYEREMIERCETFLLCIQTRTPPAPLPPPPIVVPPEKWRTVDLRVDEPNWAEELKANLLGYDNTADAAELHDVCARKARELVPDDVGRVLTGDFVLARNKKGIISIRRAA